MANFPQQSAPELQTLLDEKKPLIDAMKELLSKKLGITTTTTTKKP